MDTDSVKAQVALEGHISGLYWNAAIIDPDPAVFRALRTVGTWHVGVALANTMRQVVRGH